MQYNYDFEVAALLVMIIVLLHFLFTRQFATEKVSSFFALLLACAGESALNIISSVGLANAEIVPIFWNKLFAFAFFALEGLSSYLIFRYITVPCDARIRDKRWLQIAGKLPFLLFEATLCLTPFIGFFYYFEGNKYRQGFGAAFGYYYIIYYILLSLFVFLWNWKKVDRRTKGILLIYSVTAILAVCIQFMAREMLLTGSGNAIILLIMYLSLQNPGEMIDPVTRVGNEQAFQVQLKGYLDRGVKVWSVTLSMQRLHRINRLLGVENSNLVLEEVGAFLRHVVGERKVFRNTPETFSVLLLDEQEKDMLLTAIHERFQEEWNVQENHIVVNTAVIVQQYPRDFGSMEEYVEMQDFMLEQARKAEHLSVLDAADRTADDYRRRERVEEALERALQEHKIGVHYQPIYSLKEKRIVSLEALARLYDEELGYIPPDEFIELAEKNGSIIALGEQVLEESCRFLAKHVLSNESLGIGSIQVNVSVAQCFRLNLEETVLPIMEKYHIPPAMITLELTEGIAVQMPELMLRHMEELGKCGVGFAMDDYGSGNSNCSYLIRFPFAEVKIDKEIVWAYFKSETAKIVLENEVRTIRQLGRQIVAEGIESKEQSDAMEQLGVEYIQGYYYGKPMPESECLRYIRKFNQTTVEYGRA